MASVDRIQYREMADQSIAKTFKGILRVANVQEAANQDEDFYFNPIYYGAPSKGIANESVGYDTAYNALTGALTRYSFSGDDYRHIKVPVTDSLGNYMNINVGADGVTFGSDELNNGNNADKAEFTQFLYSKKFTQDKIFPVLEAENVIIGLKPRVLSEEKTSINTGTVTIDPSPYYDKIDSQVIVNNNYDHSPDHISTDGHTYKELDTVDQTYKYRTIYQVTNNTLKDYDALVYYQDNIDEHNLKNNKIIDSFVDVVNLKDYVKEKLSYYLNGNIAEMPTGTVIKQYVSLAKWYCIGDSFTGNFPPMGRIQDTNNYTPTLYQGLVRKGINRIIALSDEQEESGGSYGSKQLKEIIPLYKRDYALADGATYTIYMLLPEMANNYDYPSYDQFINLFFCLGYQYTDFTTIRDHYENEVARQVDGENVYGWKNGRRAISDACKDKDVLFGVDLLSMLALKAIYNELKTGTSNNGRSACLDETSNMYSRTNAENWLKTQKLPREYIFNSPIPSADGGMVYEYTTASEASANPATYNFEIGLEVNSFDSLVRYYDHTSGSYVNCKAWQTAEVQAVLDLFEKVNIARERELKSYYSFPFQVPNLVQEVSEKYKTGAFVGYSAFVWANENKDITGLESVSSFSSTSHPHRHAITTGPLSFKSTPDITYNTGAITNTSMTRAEGVEQWISVMPYKSFSFNVNAYTLAEMSGIEYQTEIHDGLAVKVIQYPNYTGPDKLDPRWKNAEPNRGITSPPIDMGIIDEKLRSASANTAEGEIKYFLPESVQMLSLIKL